MPQSIRRRREGITIARPRSAKHVLDKDLWSEGRERIAAAALPLFLKYGYHPTPDGWSDEQDEEPGDH